jgi:hypothetical protein
MGNLDWARDQLAEGTRDLKGSAGVLKECLKLDGIAGGKKDGGTKHAETHRRLQTKATETAYSKQGRSAYFPAR